MWGQGPPEGRTEKRQPARHDGLSHLRGLYGPGCRAHIGKNLSHTRNMACYLKIMSVTER